MKTLDTTAFCLLSVGESFTLRPNDRNVWAKRGEGFAQLLGSGSADYQPFDANTFVYRYNPETGCSATWDELAQAFR